MPLTPSRIIHDPASFIDLSARHVYTAQKLVSMKVRNPQAFGTRPMPGEYFLEVKVLIMAWWLSAADMLVVTWKHEPYLQRYHSESETRAEAQTACGGSVRGRWVLMFKDALEGVLLHQKGYERWEKELERLIREANDAERCWATGKVTSTERVTEELEYKVDSILNATKELVDFMLRFNVKQEEDDGS
jgi:hypothetical protein